MWPVIASSTGERKKRKASTVSARLRPAFEASLPYRPPIFSASSSSSWRSDFFEAATYSITSWKVRCPQRRNSSRWSTESLACHGCPA